MGPVGEMIPLVEAAAPVSLAHLAARIRRSSNFRFEWQWFSLDAVPVACAAAARGILGSVVSDPACHRLLQDSFENLYEPEFRIEPLHEHCRVVDAGDGFAGTLAQAATDRLGAYSRELIEAAPSEVEAVRNIFAPVWPYSVFSLEPGNESGCPACADFNNHLFTNWFYGVAWDWCFCLLPHGKAIAWVGCLTDTD